MIIALPSTLLQTLKDLCDLEWAYYLVDWKIRASLWGMIMHVLVFERVRVVFDSEFLKLMSFVWAYNRLFLCEGIKILLLSLNLYFKQALWVWVHSMMVSQNLKLAEHNWTLHGCFDPLMYIHVESWVAVLVDILIELIDLKCYSRTTKSLCSGCLTHLGHCFDSLLSSN